MSMYELLKEINEDLANVNAEIRVLRQENYNEKIFKLLDKKDELMEMKSALLRAI